MVTKASKAPAAPALDISLASYDSVALRDVRARADNSATKVVYRNPFNGQDFAHDANYTEFHGRPGRVRTVQRQFGKDRLTVQFLDGSQVTATLNAFVLYHEDLLPVITAAHTETKSCYDQAKNKLQAFGRWISIMAEHVDPRPRTGAPSAAELAELPF